MCSSLCLPNFEPVVFSSQGIELSSILKPLSLQCLQSQECLAQVEIICAPRQLKGEALYIWQATEPYLCFDTCSKKCNCNSVSCACIELWALKFGAGLYNKENSAMLPSSLGMMHIMSACIAQAKPNWTSLCHSDQEGIYKHSTLAVTSSTATI